MAKAIDKSKMLTDKKSFIGKCIHTFKCMFNPGGKDCVKLGKDGRQIVFLFRKMI